MSFAGRTSLHRGLFWGIATIFLLVCGQHSSARTLAMTEIVTAASPATTVVSVPTPSLRVPSDNWEPSGSVDPQQAALSRDRLNFSPLSGLARAANPIRFPCLFTFPRENHHIPSLLEIRGMLPWSLAPPALLS